MSCHSLADSILGWAERFQLQRSKRLNLRVWNDLRIAQNSSGGTRVSQSGGKFCTNAILGEQNCVTPMRFLFAPGCLVLNYKSVKFGNMLSFV